MKNAFRVKPSCPCAFLNWALRHEDVSAYYGYQVSYYCRNQL